MRRLLTLLSCMLLLFGQLAAQNRTITGRVTDSTGAAIAGATVVVKGTGRGTSTGADGSFSISVAPNAKALVISAVNFPATDFDIKGKTELGSITLHQGTSSLNEVVVVAYGVQRKTNITGSVATISGGQVADKPFTSVDKAMQGAVAGVQSTSSSGAPGANTDIRIRGIGSISAGSSPVWVIDGVIASTGDLSQNTTTSNALSSLNPDDIESITVLKDAASASIYGSRAGNGVILVTTKKGKAGKMMTSFTTEVGANSQAFHPTNKPMTTPQTQTNLREALINANIATDNASADAAIIDPNGYVGLPADWLKTNTDWTKVVTRTGTQQSYNLSLSGGDQKTQWYASGSYFKQLGTVIASDLERYTGSLSLTHKANDRLTITAALSGGANNQNTPGGSSSFLNPVMETFFLVPWYAPYNADGSLKYNDADNEFPANGGLQNPVIISKWDINNLKQTTLRGHVSGEYKILDNLKFTSRYSGEYFDYGERQYWNPFYGDGYAYGGLDQDSYRRTFDYTWSNFADYKGNLNAAKDIYFDLKAGYEAYKISNYYLYAVGTAYPQTLDLTYLTSSATPLQTYSSADAASTTSIFSMADINYKDRYVLSGSFRRDKGSVFGANKQSGNFWSVGATWNVIEEDFMKSQDLFSLLKLRASEGVNGNNQLSGYYLGQATFSYGYNYTGLPGSALSNVGNPDLTWENNHIGNIGLDWGILKNRLTGTFEVYDRKTDHLLLNVPLSTTSGFGSQTRNVGAMTNKGIEITLAGRPVQTKDFSWDASFNFATNRNRVTELYQGKPITSQTSTGSFSVSVGHDIHDFYLKQYAGVNTNDGTPLWYTDGTHSKTTSTFASAPLALSGKSASPKYFGSFTNTFSYKGLSLSAQLYYNFGNYVFFYWAHYLESDGAYLGGYGQLSEGLNSWKKAGDKTDVPQVIYGGNSNATSNYGYSTRYLYKGDYIRLRDVTLSYSIPKSALKQFHIANITVYVRGTNLLTFDTDKRIPLDPEAGINSSGNFDVFIPKTITGGLKLGF